MRLKGFTLVELILSIALIGILFAFGGVILTQGLDSYAHISERQVNLQQSRYAMDRMVKELAIAGAAPATRIQMLTPTKIDFIDDQGNSAYFDLNNQILRRGTGTGNNTLAENVTSLTFTGLDQNGNNVTNPSQIRRVRIQLSTLPSGQTAPLNLRTYVFIRNYLYEAFQ